MFCGLKCFFIFAEQLTIKINQKISKMSNKAKEAKLLTFGMACMNKGRREFGGFVWPDLVLKYYEQPDAVLWEIDGNVYCSFTRDGLPFLELIVPNREEKSVFNVAFMCLETMRVIKDVLTYPNSIAGIYDAKEDAANRKLTSRFLTCDPIW